MIALIRSDAGETLGLVAMNPKQFSTGSVGFHGDGKIEIDGKRYQTNINLVEIGSKPGSAK